MHLAACAQNRDNNFNLLRALAAYAVLVTHGRVWASGDASIEPLRARLGESLGRTAVDVFFAISGFLVTASLINRGSVADYARARVMRIYPALLVVILLSVFVAGPLLTELSTSSSLNDKLTWVYPVKGATLVAGVANELPGVFRDSPCPRTFNGSLWTLPVEIWMYITLAVLWLLARRIAPRSVRLFGFVVLGVAIGCGVCVIAA